MRSVSPDSGFFSVAVAGTLIAICLVGVAIIALSQRTAQLALRREQALTARYAADAITSRTLREISAAGLASFAWANVQRRETWSGQASFVRIITGPWDDEARDCLRTISLPVDVLPRDQTILIAGTETPSGPRAEIAVLLPAGASTTRQERRLLGGAIAACVLS